MKVYRISKCKYIEDLSGYGAFMNGGRWNAEGVRMLYCSSSASLALLETLAHLPSYLASQEFCLLTLEIPDKLISVLSNEMLPADWNALPFPFSTQKAGNSFIIENKSLALQVPSVIIESESNILINPQHKDFSKVKILSSGRIQIDKRLKQSS